MRKEILAGKEYITEFEEIDTGKAKISSRL